MKIFFFILQLICIPIFIFISRATIIIMTKIGFHNLLLENGLERENIYTVFFVISCFFCRIGLRFIFKTYFKIETLFSLVYGKYSIY